MGLLKIGKVVELVVVVKIKRVNGVGLTRVSESSRRSRGPLKGARIVAQCT